MKNKVYCYYKDNKGIWKPATQERFDGSIIVWKMFPFKQGNSWGFQGERICYKNSDELWRMFRIYLDYKKSKTSGQVCVNINGKDAKIIFGSGLSCEELNKQETCSDCRASSKSQLYSEQLNCKKTGTFVNKNQKACSHIEKDGIKGYEIIQQINSILKSIDEEEIDVKDIEINEPYYICIDDHSFEVNQICNILDKYGIQYTTDEEDHKYDYEYDPNYDGSLDGVISSTIEFIVWDMNKVYKERT